MKKDHVLKDFFSYPIRFADFMNALFFDGHAIIHPCDLHPLDSREIFIGDFLSKERTHDVIMMWERKDFQAILILEAQSSVGATLTGREDILEKNERRWRNSGNVFILERCREIRYGKRKTTREVRFNPATIKENLREAYTRAGNQVRKK